MWIRPLWFDSRLTPQIREDDMTESADYTIHLAGGSTSRQINCALRIVHAAGGGTVCLGPGEYLMNEKMAVPQGCLLTGATKDD